MNYFPFHIGDYAAHTAHLSWEEDIAYRRMLDWYYLNEKALPGDAAKVARLIRMPKSREVIDTVLAEFFVLSDDGFHNKRADAELTGMLEKQEQQSSKDAHEADRMKRYRERRAQMFEALRKIGIVPAWDVAMKELQRLVDANCNGPATDLQREQGVTGNADATAIPTPTPTPTPKEDKKPTASSTAKLPTCPVNDLIDLYHQILPNLPAVRVMGGNRERALRKLWEWVLTSKRPDHTPRATNADEALAWFREYFTRATENDFLMGRTPRTGPHANWQCDLDFLLTERGLRHVIEKTQGGDTE